MVVSTSELLISLETYKKVPFLLEIQIPDPHLAIPPITSDCLLTERLQKHTWFSLLSFESTDSTTCVVRAVILNLGSKMRSFKKNTGIWVPLPEILIELSQIKPEH